MNPLATFWRRLQLEKLASGRPHLARLGGSPTSQLRCWKRFAPE